MKENTQTQSAEIIRIFLQKEPLSVSNHKVLREIGKTTSNQQLKHLITTYFAIFDETLPMGDSQEDEEAIDKWRVRINQVELDLTQYVMELFDTLLQQMDAYYRSIGWKPAALLNHEG